MKDSQCRALDSIALASCLPLHSFGAARGLGFHYLEPHAGVCHVYCVSVGGVVYLGTMRMEKKVRLVHWNIQNPMAFDLLATSTTIRAHLSCRHRSHSICWRSQDHHHLPFLCQHARRGACDCQQVKLTMVDVAIWCVSSLFERSVLTFAGLYAAAGAVPLAYVLWASAPFVAFVHLRPPLTTRRSKQALMKFVDSIPPEAEFDFTTLKAFGRARVTRVPFGELRPTKGSLGIQNIVRRSLVSPSPKKWWQGRIQSSFYVGTNRLGINAQGINKPEIWNKVLRQIRAKND